MKNDGTHFFVVNTPSLWQAAGKIEGLLVGEPGIALSRSSEYSYEETWTPGSVVPRSMDRDGCGVFYIIDDQKGQILVLEIRNQYSYWLKCLDFKDPVSVAVSDTDIYVVDGEKLYCLTRLSGQIRWIYEAESRVRIATLDEDALYALNIEQNRVFKLEWTGEMHIEEIELSMGESSGTATDIASDREDNFYILYASNRVIFKFDRCGRLLQEILIPFKEDARYLTLAAESSDDIFLGFKSDDQGGGAGESLKPADSYGIVRLSKAVKYDDEGIYISHAFDSTLAGCRWHRVVLEAEIPANTRVELSYLASDEWSETVTAERFQSVPLVNPVDSLLSGALGRYLWIRIQMFRDEAAAATPVIQSLRIDFPRNTYLRYLPETYQEDQVKREFLERFLSLFETFLSRSDGQILTFTEYLDGAAAPAGFIPWLSSWLAIAVDENWPLEKKRLLLQLAPDLYRKRGTPRCLSRIIELFYGQPPIIVEPFRFDCIRDKEIKELVTRLFGDSPHRFTVLVPPTWRDTDPPVKKAKPLSIAERNTLQRIVDIEKPAHTSGTLQVLQPWFYLDRHTYLGLNSVLTKPEFILEVSSVLGRDTVIYDLEPAGQVGRKSRIEIDSTLT